MGKGVQHPGGEGVCIQEGSAFREKEICIHVGAYVKSVEHYNKIK